MALIAQNNCLSKDVISGGMEREKDLIDGTPVRRCKVEWNQQLLRLFRSLRPENSNMDQPVQLAELVLTSGALNGGGQVDEE
jgi:hypothetical protein